MPTLSYITLLRIVLQILNYSCEKSTFLCSGAKYFLTKETQGMSKAKFRTCNVVRQTFIYYIFDSAY